MNKICIATVQSPEPNGKEGYDVCVQRGLAFAKQAAEAGAKIICLPEYFGVFGIPSEQWGDLIQAGDNILAQCCELASRYQTVILYPSIEAADGKLFNTTWIIGNDGKICGKYRKVHLTLSERQNKGLSAGSEFPVFSLCGLKVGIMTCYDGYFPETARILALHGAQIIFWPSLQRSATDHSIMVQACSRAMDNCVYIVRSTFGHPIDVVWKPGMMPGMSCIVDCEGRIIADLGRDEGFLTSDIPTGEPRPRARSFEDDPSSPRTYLFEDRRPETYGKILNKETF